MTAAGGASGRRGSGRLCPFSIEHILSGLPERSPPARAAPPPLAAGRQSPAEPGAPGTPEAAPCACCCCCGPRAAPQRAPEPASGLGEWAEGAGPGVPSAARWDWSPAPAPRLNAPSPRRRAAALAGEARTHGALALGLVYRRLWGAAGRWQPRAAATHEAPPHHLQRGAAAGAGGALRAEPVPRRGHAGAAGRPHPPARGACRGVCPRLGARSAEAPGARERQAGPGREAGRNWLLRKGRSRSGDKAGFFSLVLNSPPRHHP